MEEIGDKYGESNDRIGMCMGVLGKYRGGSFLGWRVGKVFLR